MENASMSDGLRKRSSTTASQRIDVLERTNLAAREVLAEERRRREAKTVRLRQARLQAE
ncbi:hypothetical protein [Rhizobium esperanzae]|uniref:hypothetical protein n=1 Tax=Rhizobium esperanzae TaxID=1967781 RepID=UPI0015954386|nr:hypothetical protein [Rhizobium esperanzae]